MYVEEGMDGGRHGGGSAQRSSIRSQKKGTIIQNPQAKSFLFSLYTDDLALALAMTMKRLASSLLRSTISFHAQLQLQAHPVRKSSFAEIFSSFFHRNTSRLYRSRLTLCRGYPSTFERADGWQSCRFTSTHATPEQ